MKFFQGSTQLFTAAFLLPRLADAADCSAPDQVFPWDQTAVSMMWSIRDWGCNNAWSRDLKMTNQLPWCFGGGSDTAPCWSGWFYWHGHPNQQACWDTTGNIISQCMRITGSSLDEARTWNGGTWSSGGEYAEAWFYFTNPVTKRALDRRDAPVGNNTVYLDIDEHGNVTVAHDFRLQLDGTTKDVAVSD